MHRRGTPSTGPGRAERWVREAERWPPWRAEPTTAGLSTRNGTADVSTDRLAGLSAGPRGPAASGLARGRDVGQRGGLEEAAVNETIVTVVGNVAQEPKMRVTSGGVRVVSFRLASTERRYNRDINSWRDGDTTFYTVSCWRAMAENVFASLRTGQPVVVHGRLRHRSYEKDGQRRAVLEIEAYALGHDLSRGISTFTKVTPTSAADRESVSELDDEPFDPVTGELLEDRPTGDGFGPDEGPADPGGREESAA